MPEWREAARTGAVARNGRLFGCGFRADSYGPRTGEAAARPSRRWSCDFTCGTTGGGVRRRRRNHRRGPAPHDALPGAPFAPGALLLGATTAFPDLTSSARSVDDRTLARDANAESISGISYPPAGHNASPFGQAKSFRRFLAECRPRRSWDLLKWRPLRRTKKLHKGRRAKWLSNLRACHVPPSSFLRNPMRGAVDPHADLNRS